MPWKCQEDKEKCEGRKGDRQRRKEGEEEKLPWREYLTLPYYNSKEVQRSKDKYPVGTRIVLDHMGDDPRPIAPGTKGTVRVVDDMGTVHCDFDNGRRLGLIPGEDSFHIDLERKQEQSRGHRHRR